MFYKNLLFLILFLFTVTNAQKIGAQEKKTSTAANNLLPFDSSFETGDFEWRCKGKIDSTTSYDGKNSLLLSGKTSYAVTPRIRTNINAGEKYILSFYARSGNPPGKLAVEIKFGDWNQKTHIIKKISDKWQRYKIELPTQKTMRSWLYLVFSTSPKRQVWLDSLQLEKEKLSPYQNTAPICIGFEEYRAPGNIFFSDGKSLDLSLNIFNCSLPEEDYEILCKTKNYYNKIISKQSEQVLLPQKSLFTKGFKFLPEMQKGYYVSEISVKTKQGETVKKLTFPFSIVEKSLESNKENSFFGIHPGRFRVKGENISQIPLKALRAVGAKWLRNYRAWVEPRKGSVQIKEKDYIPGLENGFMMFETINIHMAPKWAKDKNGDIKKLEDSGKYIEKLIPLLKKYSQTWELVNEPNLQFGYHKNVPVKEAARKYADILKIVSAASRKAAPDVKIAACGVTIAQSNIREFIDEVLKTEIDSFDIMPVHPYPRSRDIGPSGCGMTPEEIKLRKSLIDIQDIIKKFNGKQKLWIGELGWSLDSRTAFLSESAKTQAEYLARTMILARSVPGLERVMWFTALGCVEKLFYEYGMWRNCAEPLPATAAYSNIARILHDVKPVKELMDGDIRAYAFESGPKKIPLAAVWKWNGESEDMFLDLPSSAIETKDIIGNNLHSVRKNDKELIKLTKSPLFLFGKNISMDEFCAKIKSATFSKCPLKITPVLRSLHSFDCALQNRTYNTVKGNVELIPPKGVAVEQNQREITLASRENFEVKFPLKLNCSPLELNGKEFEIKCKVANGNFISKKKVSVNLESCYFEKIDFEKKFGLLAFQETKPYILSERKNINPPDLMVGWNGEDDLSAKTWIAWDAKYFYFQAQVKDDIFHQKHTGRRIWMGDSLQISFDTQNDAQEGVKKYDKNDYEFSFALTPKGPEIYSKMTSLSSAEATKPLFYIEREKNLIFYKIAIPWNLLKVTPKTGKIIGFNFIINDNDGYGRSYWMGLNPGGIAEIKDPYSFKKFVLIKKDLGE
jgi:hypothetical protein